MREGNVPPSFIADMHLSHWKKHGKPTDYLLPDYTFAMARKHIPAVRDMAERVPFTETGPLGKCLNEKLSEEKRNEYRTRYDSRKLACKVPLRKTTAEGKKTHYGHILETYLPLDKPQGLKGVPCGPWSMPD